MYCGQNALAFRKIGCILKLEQRMNHQYETTPNKHTPDTSPVIIEYPDLVDVVQLSIARRLDIEGSLESSTYSALHVEMSDDQRALLQEHLPHRFDEELVGFVTASLVGNRHRQVIIIAEASEGFNGFLPWESRLHERSQLLQRNRLAPIPPRVERYSTDDAAIERLTEIAQAEALPQRTVF